MHCRREPWKASTTAKKQATEAVERQVSNAVTLAMVGIQQDITTLGTLSDAGARTRIGMRAGLEDLISLKNTATNENLRIRATSLLKVIANDYENAAQRAFNMDGITNAVARLHEVTALDLSKHFNLLQIIRNDSDVSNIASAFLILREWTKVKFEMFDFKSVEQWFKQHPENFNQ